MSIAVFFTVAKTWAWKQPKCPSMDEWTRKMWPIYAMEYYSGIKKKEVLAFTTARMNLEGIMLSEMRQRKTWNLK